MSREKTEDGWIVEEYPHGGAYKLVFPNGFLWFHRCEIDDEVDAVSLYLEQRWPKDKEIFSGRLHKLPDGIMARLREIELERQRRIEWEYGG